MLYEVAGKPLLEYLLERLERCRHPADVIVATSVERSDDSIEEYCCQKGVNCYHGPLDDVAKRFKEVVEEYRFDGFVRVCGDSPLLDPLLVDRAVEIFRDGEFDLVTNTLRRTFPNGQSVEVLRSDTFCRICDLMERSEDREHVTRYFYNKPEDFRIYNLSLDQDYSWLQLTIDYPEDIEWLAAILACIEKPHWEYGLQDIIRLRCKVGAGLRTGQDKPVVSSADNRAPEVANK